MQYPAKPVKATRRATRLPVYELLANAAEAVVLLPRINLATPEDAAGPNGQNAIWTSHFGDLELIGAAESGLTPQALEKFFEKDMAYARKIAGKLDPDSAEAAQMSRFAHDLNVTGRFNEPEALLFHNPHQLTGRWLARDPRSKKLLGFVKFSLSYGPPQDDLLGHTEQDQMDAALGLGLAVEIDFIYVAYDVRGQGICQAFLEQIAELYREALFAISAQLKPTMSRYRAQFKVKPTVENEWASTAGQSAHNELMDLLCWHTEEFWDDTLSSNRKYALKLEMPDDSESGF